MEEKNTKRRRTEDDEAESIGKVLKTEKNGVEVTDAHLKKPDCTVDIAEHYNQRKDSDLSERWKSRNLYQKNFNNWIKSVIIGTTLQSVREGKGRDYGVDVMDMCSGKGGDLLKWKIGNIHKLVCIDIADVSVEQSKSRYEDLKKRNNRLFEAEFITADCTKTRVKDLFAKATEKFDIVSSQFCFHYCFESLPQARVMMKNASESLKEGGYFIGTTIDSNAMLKRLRAEEGMTFGNEVFKVKFDLEDKHNIPLFSARYHFYLEGSVDCPEFLVYFPLMKKLAEEAGLELVFNKSFKDFYDQHCNTHPYKLLLKKMFSLEEFPPCTPSGQLNWPILKYTHASHLRQQLKSHNDPSHQCIGTLSSEEWEIASLYQVFAFRKRT